MFGWTGRPDAAQTAEIAAAKQVIYDGFKAAVAAGVPKEKAGILVDEQFGAAILRDAPRTAFTPPAPPRRAARTNSTSNTATTSPSTSRRFTRRSAKCWCATTPKATSAQRSGRQRGSSDCPTTCTQESQPVHVRTPGAGGESAARRLKRRQEGIRPGAAAQADGAGDRGSCRTRASSPMCGRSKAWTAARIARRSWRPRGAAAATKSAASCWAAAKTTQKSTSGWRSQPPCRGSSASRSAAPISGSRSSSWRAKKITREAAVAEIARRYREFAGHLRECADW